MYRAAALAGLLVLSACGSGGSGDSADDGAPPSAGSLEIDGFRLQVSLEGEELEMTMEAPTTGWVAVGFDPEAAMRGADMAVGYVEEDEVHLMDHWGDGATSHRADSELGGSGDLTPVSWSEADGATTITFRRPAAAGDAYDRPLTPGGTHTVIAAYGRDDADDFESHHAWAALGEVTLPSE